MNVDDDKENVWGDIFNWKTFLAFALGILLKLSASALPIQGFWSFTSVLAQDIGTALLVAVFVWAFFEVASRRQQEKRLDARIERITKNVFFGVFRRDLPIGLINEASILILEANIIRNNFSVTYTLIDDTYKNDAGEDEPFVKLRAVAQFDLKNIGVNEVLVPIGVGLPNPIRKQMQEKSDISSIKIRRGEEPEQNFDLSEAKKKMRKAMEDPKNNMAMCIATNYSLPPAAQIHVYADYVLAKESEDTEVLQVLYPSDGVRVTVIDRTPNKRIVRARSIHRANLRDGSSPEDIGTHIFDLDHHLLPHQGIMVWWKTRPPTLPIGEGTGG